MTAHVVQFPFTVDAAKRRISKLNKAQQREIMRALCESLLGNKALMTVHPELETYVRTVYALSGIAAAVEAKEQR